MSTRTSSVRPAPPSSPPAPAESSNANEDVGTRSPYDGAPLLEVSGVEKECFGCLQGLLQAVLAEHHRIIFELSAENRRLRGAAEEVGADAARAEAARDDEGWWDGRRLVSGQAAVSRHLCEAATDAGAVMGRAEEPWDGSAPAQFTCSGGHTDEQPMVRGADSLSDAGGIEAASAPLFELGIDAPQQSAQGVSSKRTSNKRTSGEGCKKEWSASASTSSLPKSPVARSKSSISAVLAKQAQDDDNVRRLVRCIEGPFDRICSVCIVLNVVFVIVQLQYQGFQRGARLGFESGGPWPDVSGAFTVVEIAFNVYFAVELVVRVASLRMKFFYNEKRVEKLHVFDTFLVVASCSDLYLYSQGRSSRGMNLSVLRPFRFLRLLRTLRILRSVKVFNKLKVLVDTVAASFMALFWSIFLLAIVMLMAALFLCQSLGQALEDETIELDTRAWIFRMYGTSDRALYTVFELTFSGGWPNYARRLVEEVGKAYSLFFFVYIITVTFAMFRIITALFLRDTLALASSDAETAIQERMKQKERYAAKLLDFFSAADTSRDGYLTLDEFEAILSDDTVKAWLSLMDLDVHDTVQVFGIIDNGDGLVSPAEFVEGILRLKGAARSQDVMRLLHISRTLVHDVSSMQAGLKQAGVMSLPPASGQ